MSSGVLARCDMGYAAAQNDEVPYGILDQFPVQPSKNNPEAKMLKSFFHTGFIVKDLEAAVAFYSDVLGLTLTMRTERTGEFPTTLLGFPDTHIKGAFFDMGDGHQLELIQYINPEGSYADFDKNDVRAAHLAFHVEDIDAFYENTRNRGLSYPTPPVPMYDDGGNLVRKASYCQDPDGNWLELVELY